jgi:hypothetical protein
VTTRSFDEDISHCAERSQAKSIKNKDPESYSDRAVSEIGNRKGPIKDLLDKSMRHVKGIGSLAQTKKGRHDERSRVSAGHPE